MPAYKTPEEFSRQAGGFPGHLQDAQRRAVGASALHIKKTVTALMAAAVGRDLRLSGVGKRGAKIGARYDVLGHSNPTAAIRATGPAHLIERDTKPHRIPKLRGARARKRFVVIPTVGVRMSANHPGTKGKHPWERGVTAAAPRVPHIFQAEVHRALKETFRL